jgi:PadR family transcriptional regulator
MKTTKADRVDLLQGTLDLLVLRTLRLGPMHGHGIGKAIQRTSEDLLQIDHGSLYPALHRMVRKGWLTSAWQDTPKGRRQLATEQSNWEQVCRAVGLVLKGSQG